MPPAARMSDKVLHDAPHCHAPIHPNVPVPHPPQPFALVAATAPTVMINMLPAAIVGTMTVPCTLPCSPGAPGVVAKGSSSVMICGAPSARLGDLVQWPTCVAPIPSPTSKIIPPCSTNVLVGG